MKNIYKIGKELFITSDEEIKEGDWVIAIEGIWKNTITKITGTPITDVWKKIILTTDQDLIKDGVQAIDDEFLEWFVKNPSCEFVEVNDIKTIPSLQLGSPNGHLMYKIIIPKEEPKQDKWEQLKGADLDKPLKSWDEPKKETLENAAKEYCLKKYGSGYYPDVQKGFIEGAKWQAERSYSEEDLREAFKQGHSSARKKGSYNEITEQEDFDKWFEQFKKK